jgi:hypothetical protein
MAIQFYSNLGQYGFMSNFYKSEIIYNGKIYPTVEHFFQAHKAVAEQDHEFIRKSPNPGSAKKIGNSIQLRDNWEQIKDKIMLLGLMCKFTQNKDLADNLIATGTNYLEEASPTDNYWGKVNGIGRNQLGIGLMKVRELLNEIV